jgi:hypothetical protein
MTGPISAAVLASHSHHGAGVFPIVFTQEEAGQLYSDIAIAVLGAHPCLDAGRYIGRAYGRGASRSDRCR